ncbi:MAG TPA: hypothetical protein QF533_09420 [Nitrospinota bacterium]|nr:hypothetical protein [Nitrospinota bacterium]
MGGHTERVSKILSFSMDRFGGGGSIYADRGIDMKTISEWMGHSNIKITMDLCAHRMDNDAEKVRDHFAGLGGVPIKKEEADQTSKKGNVKVLLK